MNIAIVLGGGGSKGAYQIGAWRALKELNIEYHIITGTSIGAFNGAMMVQGDYEWALELWDSINIDKVAQSGLNLRPDMNYYRENSDKLLAFVKSYANHKGMDITPLKNIIHRSLKNTFFTSNVDYGLVSVKFPAFTPVLKAKSELNMDNLAQWILASASCFPAFPLCEIDGESYIDGGYYDNLPVHFALTLGAEQVIAIALNPNPHPYLNHPLVRTIQPLKPLGYVLDFDETNLRESMELGYLDTMKSFGRLWGRAYSFRICKDFMQKCAYAFNQAILQLLANESAHVKALPFKLHKAFEILTPMQTDRILALLSEQSPYISHLEYICASEDSIIHERSAYRMALHLIESTMSYHGLKRDKIYACEDVCADLYKRYGRALNDEMFNHLQLEQSDEALIKAFFALFATLLFEAKA